MLRILSYNLLVGFQTHPERKSAALAWIAAQKPDILALQEMNGYTPDQLARESVQWDHAHSVLAKIEGYAPALTSRAPFDSVERIHDGLRMGLIVARTANLDVYALHLNACSWAERHREATRILARAQESIRAGRHTVVLGDFNALSTFDADYDSNHPTIREYLRQYDREYGWSNIHDGELDFSVMELFAAAGLVDVIAQRTPESAARMSYPTPMLEADPTSGDHLPRSMRLDYVLATPELAERCRRAGVVRDEATSMQSDHYPVFADFEL